MTKTWGTLSFQLARALSKRARRSSHAKRQPVTVRVIVRVGIRRPQSPPLGTEWWVHGEGNNGIGAFLLLSNSYLHRVEAKSLHLYGLNRNPFQIKITRSRVFCALESYVYEKNVCLAGAVALHVTTYDNFFNSEYDSIAIRDPWSHPQGWITQSSWTY